jgi:hypothetical protein
MSIRIIKPGSQARPPLSCPWLIDYPSEPPRDKK